MLDERFVYLTLLLNLGGTAHYITMIFAGQVRPNRASWLLWAIAPAVVFAAELAQGVGLRSLMTFGIALGPLLVVIASYATKAAYWKLGVLDWACGGLSGLAIAMWVITDSAVVAIVLSIAADAVAAIPTVRKTITHPHTENPLFFVLVSLGGAVTLLTIQRWTFADWAFPLYIFLFPGFLAVLIWRRQSSLRHESVAPGRAPS
ncbi:hypothetical protein [Nocardioides sp.]|uniref:hypothetical protein n=1 Tax=Nocardioides sp. TaxID=35761 RepID=UPI00286D8077|nr:hypothetical protein [Nocardioides sp.]